MRRFLFDHALLPSGFASGVAVAVADGAIVSVEPGGDGERVSGIALPGLPNLHSHAFQRGMAGLSERRGPAGDDFWSWREVMYRFLARLTPDDVAAIAAMAYCEMLERGFTAVGEFHYLHHGPDGRSYDDLAETASRVAEAAAETGIGLTLLPCFYAHGGFGGAPPTEGQRRFLNDLSGFERLLERSREVLDGVPDAALGVAPHSLRAVTPHELARVAALAPGGPIHIHAAEQTREVEDCVAWSGRRPVEWLLDETGVDERWCLVHATHMTSDETARLARRGAVTGLCPFTEASLGDGVFDGPDYLAAGGRFGVGTDSNVVVDAPGELRQLEGSQRLHRRGRNLMATREGESTGARLYREALAGGAQALGRRIGAIEPGRRADLVVLDPSHPALAAAGSDTWLDAYIFADGREAIGRVIVGGETVVEGGRHRAREAIRERYRRTMRQVSE